MTQPVPAGAEQQAGGTARVGWILAGLILLSFGAGVVLYSAPEQRAQKLEEIKHKYDAKQQHYRNLSGNRQ